MNRQVVEQIRARPASDGAGVKLLRVFGGAGPERFDPFLMLDEFGSNDASDYIGGFPSHPHRGFATITYMLQGKMEHRDHMDNVGLIGDGDVQWMTAGRGIIHSEMPRQTEGKMRGFQFWLNLPANKKMSAARYQDVKAAQIPEKAIRGVTVKAIAGAASIDSHAIQGFFSVEDTEATVLDIHLPQGEQTVRSLSDSFNVLAYVYDGSAELTDARVPSPSQTLTRLSGGGELLVKNASSDVSRVLIIAGKPLKEPIVQHGPFVMNSVAEIEQAIIDYQNGVLATSLEY